MYAFSMLAVCIIMTITYKAQKRLFPQYNEDHDDEDEAKSVKDSFSPSGK